MSLIISTITNNFFSKIKKNPAFNTCPNGNLLVYETIINLDLKNIENIYIIINRNDVIEYFYEEDLTQIFSFENKNVNIMFIDKKTKNQPETIYNCIKKYNIKGCIFIKDFNSIINCCPIKGNYVYYIKSKNFTKISNVYNKSFINLDNLKKVMNISEKKIISDNICIGLYSFKSTDNFIDNYEKILKIKNIGNDLYISHIIFSSIINDESYYGKEITKYHDVTYYNDWLKFCNRYKTFFIDIDGTLVLNSGEYSKTKWGETKYIKKNVDWLNNIYNTGTVQIILTTARKSKYKNETIKQLEKYNIPYDNIIYDLYHSKRFLINDYANTNPFPSAISINLLRNNDNLDDYFTF
tara:strand:+ start:1027 stop:2085 length:1059 start_codon:yes stop_codon:yes gene_type:complete